MLWEKIARKIWFWNITKCPLWYSAPYRGLSPHSLQEAIAVPNHSGPFLSSTQFSLWGEDCWEDGHTITSEGPRWNCLFWPILAEFGAWLWEWALLALFDHLWQELDRGNAFIFLLLDLSVAFNTIKHDILLDWLFWAGTFPSSSVSFSQCYLCTTYLPLALNCKVLQD